MSDTGFDSSRNAMAESTIQSELYASLYAHDAKLAHLIDCWPRLNNTDRQILAAEAERLASNSTIPAELK